MANKIVAGELYEQITGQLFEIGRQLRQKNGYPFEPEHLKKWLQMAIEGRFQFYPPQILKIASYDPYWNRTKQGPDKIGFGTYRIYVGDEDRTLHYPKINVASIRLVQITNREHTEAFHTMFKKTDLVSLDAKVCQALFYEKDHASLEWLRLTKGITVMKFGRTRVTTQGGSLGGLRPLVLFLQYTEKNGWELDAIRADESWHIPWACMSVHFL